MDNKVVSTTEFVRIYIEFVLVLERDGGKRLVDSFYLVEQLNRRTEMKM